ncbi:MULTISPECIES: acyltransferase [Glaesserella]|uniref:Acyltransferase n=1 Tax=Glaesserella australis TaxID=2094024 RepID=A0A328C0D4_9PAST|nr:MULTISPECIES: acyltransferase [Glaesserella]AUI65308.1 hypothetical protein CJD39_01380 [Glaesserella sp. 15-184]RAL18580.1 acyltransferase [Glaesserella australis]
MFTPEFHQTLPLLGIFVLCLAVSHFLLKPLPLLSQQSANRHSPLDGLRGILALSVLVHHFYITFTWKTGQGWVAPKIHYLNNLGSVSVSLFFMTTAYLFLSKINANTTDTTTNNQPISWLKLLKSRLKRILPMYLLMILVVCIITLYILPSEYYTSGQFFQFLFHWLKFNPIDLNGFNSGFISSHAQWTLIYEWGFYFCLPLIYLLWQQKKVPLLIISLASLVAFLVIKNTNYSLYWLFVLALPSVVCKTAIQQFVKQYQHYLHLPMVVLFSYIFFFTQGYSAEQMCLIAVGFALISNGYSFGGLLNTMGLRKLGEISYSIYLSHGIYLYLAFSLFNLYDFNHANLDTFIYYLPMVYFVTVISSILTYWFIERPFLKH